MRHRKNGQAVALVFAVFGPILWDACTEDCEADNASSMPCGLRLIHCRGRSKLSDVLTGVATCRSRMGRRLEQKGDGGIFTTLKILRSQGYYSAGNLECLISP